MIIIGKVCTTQCSCAHSAMEIQNRFLRFSSIETALELDFMLSFSFVKIITLKTKFFESRPEGGTHPNDRLQKVFFILPFRMFNLLLNLIMPIKEHFKDFQYILMFTE